MGLPNDAGIVGQAAVCACDSTEQPRKANGARAGCKRSNALQFESSALTFNDFSSSEEKGKNRRQREGGTLGPSTKNFPAGRK